MFIVIILVYITIGTIEIVPMIKNNQKKELILYSITLFIAFVISLLLSLGVEIPSPAKGIEKIVLMILGK